jgi:hypothetical protein
MKAFKAKRGSELYYPVELPRQLSGEGKRRSVMGKRRGEAMEKAQKEVERHARGLDCDAGEKTVEAFLAEFLIYYGRAEIAPSIHQDYRYHVDAIDKKLSLRTGQYSCAVLRRALQFAVDWKYIR